MSGPLLFVVAAVSLMPAAQQERQMGGAGILIFTDPGYRGQNATFRQDVADLSSYRFNDRISSFRVAPGEMWEVCESSYFRGRCQVFYGEEPDLRSRGWSDRISSLRRVSGSGGGFPPVEPPVRPPWGASGIELFSDRNYQGNRRMLTEAWGDLRSLNFDNRAASLRIHGSQPWEVCADSVFRNCLVVNSDWGDLRRLGPYRQISSVRPWNSGGDYGGPTTLPGVVEQLRLYEHVGYGGRNLPITQDMPTIPSVFGPLSARVTGGVWQVCDGANFGGRCVVINRDVADLRAWGLRGRVRSARPSQ